MGSCRISDDARHSWKVLQSDGHETPAGHHVWCCSYFQELTVRPARGQVRHRCERSRRELSPQAVLVWSTWQSLRSIPYLPKIWFPSTLPSCTSSSLSLQSTGRPLAGSCTCSCPNSLPRCCAAGISPPRWPRASAWEDPRWRGTGPWGVTHSRQVPEICLLRVSLGPPPWPQLGAPQRPQFPTREQGKPHRSALTQ